MSDRDLYSDMIWRMTQKDHWQGDIGVEGARLTVEVDGAGDAVVFVHGFALDRRLWEPQLAEVSSARRAVRYDLRGFGTSSVPNEGEAYSHSSDLAALLNRLEIEHVSIVALSLGAWIAVDFALTWPGRTRSLVLASPGMWGYEYSPEVTRIMADLWKYGSAGELAEARARWLACPLFDVTRENAATRDALFTMAHDYSGWHFLHDDPHVPLKPPPMERLSELHLPVQILIGERDLDDYHVIARLLNDGIHDSRVAIVERAGHLPNLDNPAVFNNLVIPFLHETT